MEVRTPKEFFDTVLQNRFKPDKAKGIDVTAQVNLTGPDGGDWTVIIREQKIDIRNGNYPSPKLTISMMDADFVDLINGKLSAQKAFFRGKIKFKGDIALALRLRDAGFL